MCKRKSSDQNEASTGCVRQTPQLKIKKKKKKKTGCVRETPHIKKVSMGSAREISHIRMKPARDVSMKHPWVKKKNKKIKKGALDVKEKLPHPHPPKRRSQHGMYKRNSPHKKVSMGCIRETPHIKRSAWDV